MWGSLELRGAPIAASSARLVRVALCLSFGVAAVATYSGASLTWDGASLLFAFLDIQDLSLPHARLSVAVFQYPTLLLSRYTTNVRALELVYGATYTSIPALSLLASWRLVRKTCPRLIAWQFLWLLIGALPGQLFYVSESLIAAHVAWPMLFAILTGLSRRALLPCLLAALFLFELHPVAGLLLFILGGVAGATALRNAAGRSRLLFAASMLFAMGAARTWVSLHDPYELSQAGVNASGIVQSLRLPRVAIASGAVAPLALLVAHLVRPRSSVPAFGILAVLALCFTATLMPWAMDAHAWQDALDYRFVAPFVVAPFLVAAAAIAIVRPLPDGSLLFREALLCAGTVSAFALILSIQSFEWFGMRDSLKNTLAHSDACVSMNSVPACRNTALHWWTTPSYALLIQGHAPRSLLLPGNECRGRRLARIVPVNPWYARPRDTGWFDLTQTGRRPR